RTREEWLKVPRASFYAEAATRQRKPSSFTLLRSSRILHNIKNLNSTKNYPSALIASFYHQLLISLSPNQQIHPGERNYMGCIGCKNHCFKADINNMLVSRWLSQRSYKL
ncbi:unnamed protein product, partial [Urochloa humidicola]